MYYNVRDFGASGDGVTDDLPAFQRALDAMKPIPPFTDVTGGAVLLVPAGNYFLSQTLWITHEAQILGISGHQGKGAYVRFFVNTAGVPQHPDGLPGGISRLLFPRGVTGIRVAYNNIVGQGSQHGAGTIIRNLVLVGGFEEDVDSFNNTNIPKVPTDPKKIGHGISAKLQVVIDNCFIYHFTGNGIHFVAPSMPSSPENDYEIVDGSQLLDLKNPELGDLYIDNAYEVNRKLKIYNANVIDSRVVDCFSRNNGLNGVYVFGSNSGNLIFDKVHCYENGRYGFFDSEVSAANLYLGCHSQLNLKGGYYCFSSMVYKNSDGSLVHTPTLGNNTGSIYIGCYQENEGTRIYAPAIVIGGALGAENIINTDFDPEILAAITAQFLPPSVMRSNANGSAITAFPNGVQAYCGTNLNGAIEIGGTLPDVALTLYHQPESNPPEKILNTSYKYQLRYLRNEQSTNENLRGWWEWNSDITLSPLRFSTSESNVGSSQIWFENGYYIGNGSSGNALGRVQIKTGETQPDGQTGKLGDQVWNCNPTPGSHIGWVCTQEAGPEQPAIWYPFGKIET